MGRSTSKFLRREAKRMRRMNLNRRRRAEQDLAGYFAAREISKFKDDASSSTASEWKE